MVMVEEKLVALRKNIFEAYSKKTSKSKHMYERACQSLEGGTPSSTRFFPPYPLYMTRGKGSKLYDLDGNEYVDCFLNAGPMILGHCHPEVMEAVRRELDRGLLTFNLDLVVECAELVKELVPCAERVRFVSTGTEATLFAAKIARAHTGKKKIIKFYGHYHGLDDQFCTGLSSNPNEPIDIGVSKESLTNTVVLKFNDIDAIRRKFDEDDDIAGVILDPQMSRGGIWPATHEYLTELKRLTEERNIVLIFDEVISGFRLAPGGAQEYFGVTPDMVTLSKAIAAGGKLSAIAGKESIMDGAAPKEIAISKGIKAVTTTGGTYVEGTIGLAAGIAAMKVYKRMGQNGGYQRLFQLAEKLKAGIETVFKERGVPLHINILGSYLKLFFTDLAPSYEAYDVLDTRAVALFYTSLITEGVFLGNPNLRATFLSFVHTAEDVQEIIDAVNNSLAKYEFGDVV